MVAWQRSWSMGAQDTSRRGSGVCLLNQVSLCRYTYACMCSLAAILDRWCIAYFQTRILCVFVHIKSEYVHIVIYACEAWQQFWFAGAQGTCKKVFLYVHAYIYIYIYIYMQIYHLHLGCSECAIYLYVWIWFLHTISRHVTLRRGLCAQFICEWCICLVVHTFVGSIYLALSQLPDEEQPQNSRKSHLQRSSQSDFLHDQVRRRQRISVRLFTWPDIQKKEDLCARVCVCVCGYVCMSACVYMCVCVCMYIYIYIYIYMGIYIHTYVYI